MNFATMPGFSTIYYIIFTIVVIGMLWFLIKSAKDSLKRTGGKITSILDEIVLGLIVVIAAIIVGSLEPSVVINFATGPIKWLFARVLDIIRWLGIPV